MRILYVTTIALTMGFFPEHFKMLINEGHEVELACNCSGKIPACCTELDLKLHDIPFSRSPLSSSNIEAYRQLKKLIETEHYDIVHTHTPNASACVRMACRKLRKQGTKVFYTAHGFHFYKGAPLKNWLLYYPVEWLCSWWTDTLITINQEDYALAQKHMHAKKIEYVPGVGIDLNRFGHVAVNVDEKRKELGIPEGMIWLLAVGELIQRKNHETLIRAIVDIPNIYLTIAGSGPLQEYLAQLIQELKLNDRIRLLGYRKDISALCTAADLFSLPSFQEGLPVALMEAMACGKPCAVSNIRGNMDLITEEAFLFDPHSVSSTKEAIGSIIESNWKSVGDKNVQTVKAFDYSAVLSEMKDIYDKIISGGGYAHVEKMYKRALTRKELGVPQDAILLISVGELNENKNHEVVIKAIKGMDVYYIIAGFGDKQNALQALIDEQAMTDRVKLLGFRTDVHELYAASDMFVFPSFREGLSVSLMEATASGLPCAVSQIRGNVDLIDEQGGALFDPQNVEAVKNAILQVLASDQQLIGQYNKHKVRGFSTDTVLKKMVKAYGIEN